MLRDCFIRDPALHTDFRQWAKRSCVNYLQLQVLLQERHGDHMFRCAEERCSLTSIQILARSRQMTTHWLDASQNRTLLGEIVRSWTTKVAGAATTTRTAGTRAPSPKTTTKSKCLALLIERLPWYLQPMPEGWGFIQEGIVQLGGRRYQRRRRGQDRRARARPY